MRHFISRSYFFSRHDFYFSMSEHTFFSFCVAKGCCQLWNTLEQRFATLEFDRDRKSMGVLVNSSSGNKKLLVKVCPLFSHSDFLSFPLPVPFIIIILKNFPYHIKR